MKGTKTSLFLIELMISLLLFAFCAAICVQIFYASNKRTNSAENLSKAVFHATTVAELYKASGGDIEAVSKSFEVSQSFYANGVLSIYFDENWNATLNPMLRSSTGWSGYTVTVYGYNDNSAHINVSKTAQRLEPISVDELEMRSDNEEIFSITVKAVMS